MLFDQSLVLAAIACLVIVKILYSLVSIIYKSSPLNQFKNNTDKDLYAVVTGASDGIGKEFALELARKGYNLLIIARTLESLHQVAEEARKNSVKVSVLQFDFSQQDFTPIKQQLDKIKVGVLINNVGVSHSIPTPFDLETSEMISRIINVNIASVLSITKLCLDQMKPRKQGLIVNMGSFSGLAPSPYLSVYGATKSFLKSWSIALSIELKPHKIHVEHLNTYFVATKMAKMRESFTCPSAEKYVKMSVKGLGVFSDRTPYMVHAALFWFLTNFISTERVGILTGKLLLDIRKRALRKVSLKNQ